MHTGLIHFNEPREEYKDISSINAKSVQHNRRLMFKKRNMYILPLCVSLLKSSCTVQCMHVQKNKLYVWEKFLCVWGRRFWVIGEWETSEDVSACRFVCLHVCLFPGSIRKSCRGKDMSNQYADCKQKEGQRRQIRNLEKKKSRRDWGQI